MNSYERHNRINEALVLRSMKNIELSEKTGIHKATISNWINQKYQPKQDSLMAMAKVLNVSEFWLAGYDVPMERSPLQQKNDETVDLISSINNNESFRDLFISISKLSPDQFDVIVSMVKQLQRSNTEE